MKRGTDPRAARRYHALIGALPAHRRIAMAASLSRSVRELCEAGIRARHPAAGHEEVRWRVAAVCYGEKLAKRVFGACPGTQP
jgi:hypothetical protein